MAESIGSGESLIKRRLTYKSPEASVFLASRKFSEWRDLHQDGFIKDFNSKEILNFMDKNGATNQNLYNYQVNCDMLNRRNISRSPINDIPTEIQKFRNTNAMYRVQLPSVLSSPLPKLHHDYYSIGNADGISSPYGSYFIFRRSWMDTIYDRIAWLNGNAFVTMKNAEYVLGELPTIANIHCKLMYDDLVMELPK